MHGVIDMDKITYKYCPLCGKKLIYIDDGYKMNVCTDSRCRTYIKDDIIGDIDLTTYSKLQQYYNFDNNTVINSNTYMLLKENLSGPMLIKNTNEPTMNLRNKYCIINATDVISAINQFKQMFKYINITHDMVIPIDIKEL